MSWEFQSSGLIIVQAQDLPAQKFRNENLPGILDSRRWIDQFATPIQHTFQVPTWKLKQIMFPRIRLNTQKKIFIILIHMLVGNL